MHAAQKAGLSEVPALIYLLDRSAAAIAVVDSNLHRERILPSEKAFAYKMKMDALRHQGKTCGQVGHKSRDDVSETESGRQIHRYIRLTNLIPALLKLVDEERIAFSQAVRMHRENGLSFEGISDERVETIMSEQQPNQKERVSLPVEQLRRYFPKHYTPQKIQDAILKLMEEQYRQRERSRDRDTR